MVLVFNLENVPSNYRLLTQSCLQISQNCTVVINLGVTSWKLAPEFLRAFHLFSKCIFTWTEHVEMY